MKKMNPWLLPLGLICLLAVSGCKTITPEQRARTTRAQAIVGTRATYCAAPRLGDGRVDVQRLVEQLIDLKANTYSYCIHPARTDWEDVQRFLPVARASGIRVWISLLPPSESVPVTTWSAEPYKLDYERWAVEFARLSLRETNLVAWTIDDFTHNLKFFTPEYLGTVLKAGREINPRLAFVPCSYYPRVTPEFAAKYGGLVDGLLFPYRHDSAKGNLTDPSLADTETKKLKSLFPAGFPVVLDVYATAHSRLGASTADYVEQVMLAGMRSADGVMVYCHQDPVRQPAKYQVIKRVFSGAGK